MRNFLSAGLSVAGSVSVLGGAAVWESEAGVVAQWLGAPFSVVSGGIGCLIATAWIAMTTPQLRGYRAGISRPAALSATPARTEDGRPLAQASPPD